MSRPHSLIESDRHVNTACSDTTCCYYHAVPSLRGARKWHNTPIQLVHHQCIHKKRVCVDKTVFDCQKDCAHSGPPVPCGKGDDGWQHVEKPAQDICHAQVLYNPHRHLVELDRVVFDCTV